MNLQSFFMTTVGLNITALNFTYNYGYAIDGIDKTELDKELLRNENWVTCACLTGEERITNSLNRHSSAVSSDSTEGDDRSGYGCYGGHVVERDKRRKREEPVTMARIPTPEERIFAQERHKEISSIFERTLENLTERQAELYKLHFEYGLPLHRVSKILRLAPNTTTYRLKAIQQKFRKEIKKQTGEDVERYLNMEFKKICSKMPEEEDLCDKEEDLRDTDIEPVISHSQSTI